MPHSKKGGKKRPRSRVHTRASSSVTAADLAAAMRTINSLMRHTTSHHRPAGMIRPAQPPPPAATAAADTVNDISDDDESVEYESLPDMDLGATVHLSDDERPATINPRRQRGNFYIVPRDVILFLQNHLEYYNNHMVDLVALGNLFNRWKQDTSFVPWVDRATSRNDPLFNRDEFIKNEFSKMFARNKVYSSKWKSPVLIGSDGLTLSIPSLDTFDLPNYLLLYWLYRLSHFVTIGQLVTGPQKKRTHVMGNKGSFMITYNFTTGDDRSDKTVYPVNRDSDGTPITINNGKISEANLNQLYNTIVRRFAALLPNSDGVTWNGSEESGTRIMLLMAAKNAKLHLSINFQRSPAVQQGNRWSPEMQEFIEKTIGGGVVYTVSNDSDNKCLAYCIILALIAKYMCGGAQTFGSWIVTPSELFCKATVFHGFVFDPRTPAKLADLIPRLAKATLGIQYSTGPTDPLVDFINDLDKQVGTMLSMTDFREKFQDIENRLVGHELGIDVYGLDYNINRHIYPLFISKTREPHINLLCITPKDSATSHYCVITNMEKLLKASGGKQFFSCSHCGKCYFHRRMLKDHYCTNWHTNYQVEGEGGYHYSNQHDIRQDIIAGSCSKCRLCFTSAFRANFHKEHCLMQGQTGYRHVQLVTYKPNEIPKLTGEAINMQDEDKHVDRRRILYADFECCINPETGEHSFMSWGLYDWDNQRFNIGFDLNEFIDYVLEIAFSGDEDQIFVYFHNAMGYDANFILRQILKDYCDKDGWNCGIQVIMKSSNRLQKLVLHFAHDGK